MEKLRKLLEWLTTGNCVPYMEFYRIYDKKSLTQEDKDTFIKWLDINNIGLSPQKRIDAYMFINKDTNEFLTTKELRATKLPDGSSFTYNKDTNEFLTTKELRATKLPEGINFVFKQPEKKKECSNINTVTCNKFDSDWPCGWLSPRGKFIETDWGEHERSAYEIICSLDKREEQRQFEKEYYSYYSRDFLVEKLNYILLDCPANTGYLSITYPNRLSKSQRIWLENYLTKINDYDTMLKVLGD